MGYFDPAGWLAELGIVRRRPSARAPIAAAGPEPPWLVAYASQMGAAERVAQATAARLAEAGTAVELLAFDALTPERLVRTAPVLIVASTAYDGDAPDMAEDFESIHMHAPAALAVRYGLLALGDRAYPDYCGFGRRLHAWLALSGAEALFPPIEVDDEDPLALAAWEQCVARQAAVGTSD